MDRADGCERIEPVPDPSAPGQHLVVFADAGDDAPEHALRRDGRLALDPERDDVYEVSEARVVCGRFRVDPADGTEHAEPEVPLPLARADERVAREQRDLLQQRRSAKCGATEPARDVLARVE